MATTSVRDGAVDRARQLVGRAPARELVPTTPGASARWHTHDYPGPYCRWHHHPEYEVHLIRHGTGRSIVGDHIGRFRPGHLVLVGSQLPHHWISDLEPGEQIIGRDVVFQFHPQWFADCRRLMPELAALDLLLARAGRGIEFFGTTAIRAAAELIAIGPATGVARLHHILTLLAVLDEAPADECTLLASPWTPPLHGGGADVIDDILGWVFTHIETDVSLGEAAARAGMSESGFSRYFRRASGQNFSDTVRKLRLAHAAQLLEQSEATIATVCRRVGYRNLSNFNRQFRAAYAVTPRDYRRQQREQAD